MLTGCTAAPPPSTPETSAKTPGPEQAITEFAGDWQAGRSQDAAQLTTDPAASTLLMTQIAGDLGATELGIETGAPTVTSDGDRGPQAEVTATMTWTVPDVGDWQYDTTWHWVRRGSGDDARWLIDFGPQSVHPGLGAGQSVRVRTQPAVAGPIVDRNDTQLIAPVRVYSVVLLVDKVSDAPGTAKALADLLHPFDDTLTAETIAAGIAKTRKDGHDSYTVLNLRENDFAPLEARLTAIAGVTLPSQVRDLPPTAGFAATLLSTAVPVATELAAGAPGWSIVSVDRSGGDLETLAEHPAEPGSKVTFTLDPAVQDAAQAAVDPVPEPTVLVAIQPSTGEILAVAQNRAADAQGPISLIGRYPPGSTFKIVTATAAMDAGVITPETTVSCPGSWTADHHTISNEGFALGRITARSAFAHSCNTTFAALASELPEDALPQAATEYGIGLDFDVAGITTLTGAIQNGSSLLARAENGFGQGTDLVTPFGAALMAATAATGNMPVPVLIRGQQTTVDHPAPERSAQVREGIRAMMRAVVTDGTAKKLRDAGEVYAKTGTAEFVNADGEIEAHAWTVGFRGDVAFAALIVAGNSSSRTNDLARAFLRALPSESGP